MTKINSSLAIEYLPAKYITLEISTVEVIPQSMLSDVIQNESLDSITTGLLIVIFLTVIIITLKQFKSCGVLFIMDGMYYFNSAMPRKIFQTSTGLPIHHGDSDFLLLIPLSDKIFLYD